MQNGLLQLSSYNDLNKPNYGIENHKVHLEKKDGKYSIIIPCYSDSVCINYLYLIDHL